MHRSYDREALNESNQEPEPALGSGSFSDRPVDADAARALLELRQRQHDAANWLVVLRGHLDLLVRHPGAEAAQRDRWLERAQRAAAAAERLLRGPGAGPGPSFSELGSRLRDFAAHAPTLLPATAQLELEDPRFERPLSAALADDDLADVLLNLLRNAAQALSPEGGRIFLRAGATTTDQVWIEVEDDGEGMSPDVVRQCLTPGFTTRGGAGRGLGLSRVHELVHAAQGSLEIDSELGRGTRVRVRVPAIEVLAGERPAPDVIAPSRESSASPRVLVIEDDADVREVLVALLEDLGATVTAAIGANDARSQHRPGAFDLVLVDRTLGDGSGDELATEVRQADPVVAIVLLTGDASASDATGAFDRVVLKPVGRADLRALLDETISLCRQRRAESEDA